METDPRLVHPSKRRANSLNRATSKQHGRRHLEQPQPASAVPCKTDTCHRPTTLDRIDTPGAGHDTKTTMDRLQARLDLSSIIVAEELQQLVTVRVRPKVRARHRELRLSRCMPRALHQMMGI